MTKDEFINQLKAAKQANDNDLIHVLLVGLCNGQVEDNQLPIAPIAYAHISDRGLIRIWSKEKTDLDSVTKEIGKEPVSLITLEQAEAAYMAGLYHAVGPQWRPIGTAPKQGKILLLFNNPLIGYDGSTLRGRVDIGFYINNRFHSVTANSEGEDEARPTHWQPLPEPPK